MHDPAEAARHAEELNALADPSVDLLALEKVKIKGAIRTDFILSAEIVVIALGTVANAAFGKQVAVLVAIAVIMTAGVYGFVAAIVKLDDAGLHLSATRGNNFWHKIERAIGNVLLNLAPLLMKTLSIVGTIAMFMVGGGILSHGIPGAHDWIESVAHSAGGMPALGAILEKALPTLFDIVIGIFTGMLVLAGVNLATRVFRIVKGRR
jgi:predicted DNA repair protein MutK